MENKIYKAIKDLVMQDKTIAFKKNKEYTTIHISNNGDVKFLNKQAESHTITKNWLLKYFKEVK